jgi:hypothetical protein
MEMFIGCLIGMASAVLCGLINTIGEDNNNDERRGDRIRSEKITLHGHGERN